jgi:hypothetical protein
MVWRHPVVDGQTHPALLGEVRHQGVALQHSAAVDPGAARYEDQHRRGLCGKIFGPPHIKELRRVAAVSDGRPVHIAAMLTHFPQRWCAFGRRPLDRQVLGAHYAAQRGLRDGVGAVALLAS